MLTQIGRRICVISFRFGRLNRARSINRKCTGDIQVRGDIRITYTPGAAVPGVGALIKAQRAQRTHFHCDNVRISCGISDITTGAYCNCAVLCVESAIGERNRSFLFCFHKTRTRDNSGEAYRTIGTGCCCHQLGAYAKGNSYPLKKLIRTKLTDLYKYITGTVCGVHNGIATSTISTEIYPVVFDVDHTACNCALANRRFGALVLYCYLTCQIIVDIVIMLFRRGRNIIAIQCLYIRKSLNCYHCFFSDRRVDIIVIIKFKNVIPREHSLPGFVI